jgi:hypothetical protein
MPFPRPLEAPKMTAIRPLGAFALDDIAQMRTVEHKQEGGYILDQYERGEYERRMSAANRMRVILPANKDLGS